MSTEVNHSHRDRTKAWWSLVLLPPAFVAAFVVGEGLLTLYGYDTDGSTTPPVWAILAAGLPALVVFAVPALVSTYFGRRGVAAGDPSARVPMLVAIALTVLFAVQNLVAFLLG